MPTQVMILAAGLGTRLWPLTDDRAKPAVPFLGEPLIARLVRHLARCGVERVVINTHHKAESVQDALRHVRAELDLQVAFSHEATILGTAGGLGLAMDRGLLDPEQPVVVVNGKLETDIDPRAALATHQATGAAVTMVLMPNPSRAAFREVMVRDGRVVGFGRGREPESEAPLLFTGIHVIGPEALARIPRRFSDTVADVYPEFIEAGRVAAHIEAEARWWEFSTLERYLSLHRQAHRLGLAPDVVCSAGAVVHPGADVQHAVLWEGAQVQAGARVHNAIIGANVSIEAGEEVHDAVVVQASGVHEVVRGRPFGQRLLVPMESEP